MKFAAVRRLLLPVATAALVACGGGSEPPRSESDVEVAKAMFSDLRNTLLAYSNSQGTGELDQAFDGIDHALSAAVQPIDDEQIILVALGVRAIAMLRDFQDGDEAQRSRDFGESFGAIATVNTDGSAVNPRWLPKFRCEVAFSTFFTTPGGQQDINTYTSDAASVTPSNANVVSCFGIGTVGRLVPGLGDDNARLHSIIVIPPETGDTYSYVHQVRRQAFDRSTDAQIRREGAAVFGSITMRRDTAGDINGAVISGRLKPGFKGHSLAGYQALTYVDTTLDISTHEDESTASLNMTGSMRLMKTDGSEASSVAINSGQIAFRNGGAEDDPEGLERLELDVVVSAPGVRFQGNVSAEQPATDRSGTVYLPTELTLRGRLSEADGPSNYRVLLDGTATARLLNFSNHDASGDAQAPMRVSFDGRILLRNRPPMGFTFDVTRNSADFLSGTGTFFWSDRVLNFSSDSASGNLVVNNGDGVTFTIPRNGSGTDQPIYRSGVLVGYINVDRKRIDYTDGTFEQF